MGPFQANSWWLLVVCGGFKALLHVWVRLISIQSYALWGLLVELGFEGNLFIINLFRGHDKLKMGQK